MRKGLSDQTKQAIRDHLEQSFVAEANGHTIRRYTRLQGDCYNVSGKGFDTLEKALEYAENNPR